MVRFRWSASSVLLASLVALTLSACGFPDYGGFGNANSGGSGGMGAGGVAGEGGSTVSSSGGGQGGGPTGCASDADCVGSPMGPVCNTGTNTCVACLPTNDVCAVGSYCATDNTCVAGCSDDSDCAASQTVPVCDTSTNTCVPCLPTNDACPQGQYCDAGNTCIPGCKEDADCNLFGGGTGMMTCETTTHTCIGCMSDEPCPPGQVCDVGTTKCVPGCTPEHACQAGATCCSSECVDVLSDQAHCGGCDTPCAPPNGSGMCEGGSCSLIACDQGFNDCDLNPANGCESNPLTDPLNCSACGTPCAPFPNAEAACAAGMCALGACTGTFADCDLLPQNGCETDVMTNATHCSACNNTCVLANSNEVCQGGTCAVASCEAGFSNCNGVSNDGCEINTQTDPQNCGTCDNVCSLPNSSTKCVMGSCRVDVCAPPFADCNLVASDGCETNVNTNVNNCGACGTVCNLPNATAGCSNGGCTIVSCNMGFGDCDGVASNGCETNLNTSVQHCGTCGAACSTNNGTPSCMSGTCSIMCGSGFANCDNNVANGCEINTTNNVNNCGTCGNACPIQGGTPACNNSVCGVSSCQAGKGDCDGNPGNGCETTTTNDINHCGGCGVACFVANGTPGCGAGTCVVASCNPGFANCDGLYSNGCETNLKTLSNCGSCGTVCSLSNANVSCATGTCEISSCTGTFANCDGNKNNGCEVNTATNTSNCGACMNACSSNNGSATCSSGACGINCAAGFGNCDANVANGCETATTNNVNACGTCGNVCSVQNGTPTCSGTTCAIQSCNAGFQNCDGQYANGCEINTTNNVNNCGSCGTTCTNSNGTTVCSGGACVPTCAPGFANCDGNPNNGCETNTNTSSLNCGACGVVCSFANGSGTCQAGTCVLTSCNANFGDCDLLPGNGCEVPLNTTSNCGTCGTTCSNGNGTTTCAAGTCSPSCNSGFASCDGNANNGCETSLTTLANCGGCGVPCDYANATESCMTGTCTLTSCDANYANCDGNTGNGCETSTANSNVHCGTCGNACAVGKICVSGSCVDACPLGQADCDGSAGNGCEVNTTNSGANCGACNMSCTSSQYCSNSACTACGANQRDCNLSGADGCEINVTTDAGNCGSCGNVCPGATNATGTCTNSICGIACNSGYASCDGSQMNGCECNRNLCCSGACAPAHINGLGQPFDNCAPLGVPGNAATYSQALAIAARAAWPFSGTDQLCSCTGNTGDCIYRQTATSCAVWVYNKTMAGYVRLNTADNTCYCPGSTAYPTWK